MIAYKNILTLSLLSLACFMALPALAQNNQPISAKQDEVTQLVDSGRYTFVAERAIPLSGRARFLTSEYYLSVSKDSVQAFLPYFGRAYTAPIDPSKGGIQFISTQFEYKIKDDKRNGWNIVVTPNDVRDIQKLSLHIFTNGNASLQVISNDRQSISFNGHITKNKE